MKKTSTLELVVFLIFLSGLILYFRKQTEVTRWRHWSFKKIPDAFERGAGLSSLRPEVLSMTQILARHSIKEIRLVGELSSDSFISYPAKESLYPVKISETANWVFSKKETEVSSCKELDRDGDIILYDCTSKN